MKSVLNLLSLMVLIFLPVLNAPAPTVNFNSFDVHDFIVDQVHNDIALRGSSNTIPIGVYPIAISHLTGTNYFFVDARGVPTTYVLTVSNGVAYWLPNGGGGGGGGTSSQFATNAPDGVSLDLFPTNTVYTNAGPNVVINRTQYIYTNNFSGGGSSAPGNAVTNTQASTFLGSTHIGTAAHALEVTNDPAAVITFGTAAVPVANFAIVSLNPPAIISPSGLKVNQVIGVDDNAEYMQTLNNGNFYMGDVSAAYDGCAIWFNANDGKIHFGLNLVNSPVDKFIFDTTSGNETLLVGQYNGNAFGETNGSPALATNNAAATDGMVLSKSGDHLKFISVTGGGSGGIPTLGGSGTNNIFVSSGGGTVSFTNYASGNGISFDGTSLLLDGINLNTGPGGSIGGNGAGLVGLNASALASGTVPLANLPTLPSTKVSLGLTNVSGDFLVFPGINSVTCTGSSLQTVTLGNASSFADGAMVTVWSDGSSSSVVVTNYNGSQAITVVGIGQGLAAYLGSNVSPTNGYTFMVHNGHW